MIVLLLRRFAASGEMTAARGRDAVDALYLALAETLPATHLTLGRRLASSPGHRARIDLLAKARAGGGPCAVPGGPWPDRTQSGTHRASRGCF